MRGGQLDGEGERVEAPAKLADSVVRGESRAGAEELDRLCLCEGRHRELHLALYVKELATRHEQAEAGARGEKARQGGRCLDHLLEVVEQKQQLALADVLGEVVLRPQGLGDRLGDEGRIAQGSQPDPEHPGLVLGHELSSSLDRKSCLARATGARQREKASAVSEQCERLVDLASTADEGARRAGQVRVRDRLEWGEPLRAQLVERDRLLDVLEPVLAEVGELELDELGGRVGEDHLPAVSRRSHSRREVDVGSDVTLVGRERRPGMQADAYLDWTGRKRIGEGAGCAQRSRRGREGEEEGVPLGIHLDATFCRACLADHTPVLGKRVGVPLSAEVTQEPG